MTFKIPKGTGRKNSSTGLPDQKFYDEIRICPKCNITVEADRCPICKRKVTKDRMEPHREKDLMDMMSKSRYEFRGITAAQALEIMSNGQCSD